MRMTSQSIRSTLYPFSLGLALLVGACSDSTGPEDHHDPAGLRAVLNGQVVVSVNAARVVTGSFTVAAGQETDHVEVQFLDEDGDVITVNPAEFYLGFTIADDAVAEIEQHEPGEFEIHVVGVAAGATTMRLRLVHGTFPGGHADYESPDIPIVVTAAGPGGE